MRHGQARIVVAAVVAVATASLLAAPALAVDGLVETTEGPVQGVRDVATGVWEFRGVPYAAAPAGARRFAAPAPPPRRTATLVADAFAPACPQVAGALPDACTAGAEAGEVVGDEDCLALNVFTPATTWPPEPTRPVMVFVHGGAFESGCERASSTALPASEDVVLVRLQYRVGLLGFLGTDEMADADPHGSAGNWGLLDVLRALAWVRDNVAAFGGDPRNVTLFGESAGGVAVCALIASPLADGLFQRAIVQSGHCQIARPLRTSSGTALDGATQAQIGAAIARELGCAEPGAARLSCLRALPARTIAGIQPALPGLGLGSLQATLDGHLLDERPLVALARRGAGGREVIVGSNRDEYSAAAVLDPALAERIRVDYAGAVRDGLDALAHVFRPLPLGALAEAILALHPDPGEPDARVAAYATLFGELYGNCPALETANVLARRGEEVFLYHFSQSVPSPLPQLAALGAFHSLDLFFVFGDMDGLRALTFAPGEDEVELSLRMRAAWSGFAARGVPATSPRWPRWQPAAGAFFEWSAATRDPVSRDYRGGRCAALRALLRSFDRDDDLVADARDNCPDVANASQLDRDGDGVGDACAPCAGEALRRASHAGGGRTLERIRPPCAHPVRVRR